MCLLHPATIKTLLLNMKMTLSLAKTWVSWCKQHHSNLFYTQICFLKTIMIQTKQTPNLIYTLLQRPATGIHMEWNFIFYLYSRYFSRIHMSVTISKAKILKYFVKYCITNTTSSGLEFGTFSSLNRDMVLPKLTFHK